MPVVLISGAVPSSGSDAFPDCPDGQETCLIGQELGAPAGAGSIPGVGRGPAAPRCHGNAAPDRAPESSAAATLLLCFRARSLSDIGTSSSSMEDARGSLACAEDACRAK